MLSDDDIDRVTKSLLEAPSGTEVLFRIPGQKYGYIELLPGLPRPGDRVTMPVRARGRPKGFVVERVDWVVPRAGRAYPRPSVEVVLKEAAHAAINFNDAPKIASRRSRVGPRFDGLP